MRESIRMVVVLACICGLSGLCLSVLKEGTSDIIEGQVLAYVQGPAIKRVYPAAENNPVEERRSFALQGRFVTVFPYKKGGKLVGVALENKSPGYGGDLGVMVGFDMERDAVLGIGITEMKETPGLGSAVGEPKFTRQFVGKPPDVKLTSAGGNIDAVSGATISSAAAVSAVQRAAAEYKQLKPAMQKAWQ